MSANAPEIRPCGEIVRPWDENDKRAFVCEHAWGEEHTHADLESYMRPLEPEECTYVCLCCDQEMLEGQECGY